MLRNWAQQNRKNFAISIGIFFTFITPLLIVGGLQYNAAKKLLTEFALARRASLAHLTAITLKEKIDRIIDIGALLAKGAQFQQFIEKKQWDEAITLLISVPKEFPYIDNLTLFDTEGTIRAATPPIPEVIGKNFTYRDYYQEVSRERRPYVSGVFERAAKPSYHVIAAAIPIIKSDALIAEQHRASEQPMLGILVLTIRLDTILNWINEIDVGADGFVYVVDHKGYIAGHPKFSPYGEVVDFSEVPAVKKALTGKHGVEITYNPIERVERITAYEQVPVYQWAVVAQEPTFSAFQSRKIYLRNLLITDGIALLGICIFVFLILRSRKALSLYHQKERVLLQSIGDGLVAIDRWWNITLFNSAAEELSGWTSAEVVGKPLRQFLKFVKQKDRTENIDFIEKAMLNGRITHMENDTILLRKDGVEIPVGDSAAPVVDLSGKVNGAIIIFRDIGREAQIKAWRSDFTYASHQLRTPVTKALWSLEIALASKSAVAMREKISLAHTALKSVNKLVTQILDVSNIDQHRVVATTTKVSLEKILKAAHDAVAPLAKERVIKLHMPQIDLTLQSDPTLLQRIFTEIFDNAIQYSHKHSVIEVASKREDDNVTISVRDEGIGIPDVQQALVFTKFFRGENIDTTNIIGAGLGLFIAKAYTQILGGKIWFVSKEKEGTTFFIQLPIKTVAQ